MPKTAPFNDLLQCRIDDHELVPELGWVVLYLPPRNYCDMRGAIEFSQKVMPGVIRITAYRGDSPDVEYTRDPRGKWAVSMFETV